MEKKKKRNNIFIEHHEKESIKRYLKYGAELLKIFKSGKIFLKFENTRGTLKGTTPTFFLHSGNTDTTKFCACAQDSYNSSHKKFQVNSTSLVCVMMNWKKTLPLSTRSEMLLVFLTTSCAVYGEENVMNLRNVQ